jgi:hypothetical protein
VFDRQLGGDDRGAAIGAIVDDFEQILAAERIEGVQSPVIELCGATHNSMTSASRRCPTCTSAISWRSSTTATTSDRQ